MSLRGQNSALPPILSKEKKTDLTLQKFIRPQSGVSADKKWQTFQNPRQETELCEENEVSQVRDNETRALGKEEVV